MIMKLKNLLCALMLTISLAGGAFAQEVDPDMPPKSAKNAELQAKLKELRQELDAAKTAGDKEKVSKLRKKVQKISKRLQARRAKKAGADQSAQ
jgi:hypothetical protein